MRIPGKVHLKMVLGDESKLKDKHHLYEHPVSFIDYLASTLAVVDSFLDFDHFFLRAELFMTLIRRVQKWLELGADGDAKNPRYQGQFPTSIPIEAYQKIWRVWRGPIWRICVEFEYQVDNEIIVDIDPLESYFVYERPVSLLSNEKAVKVPALQNLNPVTQIKDTTELGIRIREHVPISDAWFGYDYAMLNTDGKFHYNFSEEQRPFFSSSEEILELKATTDYVSQEYFHTVIDIEIEEYEKWETEIYLFLQSLIKLVKQGIHHDAEKDSVTDVFKGVEG